MDCANGGKFERLFDALGVNSTPANNFASYPSRV
nr:MAG TPA: hypothetical protein [Caudoviricetes sp.]